jgi:hypothetical protein
MKINVKNSTQGYLFDDIDRGEVFYSDVDPDIFMLRTDVGVWPAVNLETGEAYHIDYFDLDKAQYHIVEAEVTIS